MTGMGVKGSTMAWLVFENLVIIEWFNLAAPAYYMRIPLSLCQMLLETPDLSSCKWSRILNLPSSSLHCILRKLISSVTNWFLSSNKILFQLDNHVNRRKWSIENQKQNHQKSRHPPKITFWAAMSQLLVTCSIMSHNQRLLHNSYVWFSQLFPMELPNSKVCSYLNQ